MRVAICVNTYRRPDQLREALRSVADLRFGDGRPPAIDVIVVNNDAETSIESMLDDLRPSFPWGLHGLVEAKRGIPQARNRAVRYARSLGVDYVAFMDDDERTAPDWLDRLLQCADRCSGALIQGRVIPEFIDTAPAWATEGRFFEGGRDEAGLRPDQHLPNAATNNLLVKVDVFDSIGLFEEWWQTQGGDDTEFTLRAVRAGFNIIWCPDAIVREWIPPGRMTVRWVLRRGFRSGNTYGLIFRRLNGTGRGFALMVVIALLCLTRMALRQIPALLLDRAERIKRQQEALFAFGTLAGIVGHKYLEYQRPYTGAHFESSVLSTSGEGIGSSPASR
jgi:succinoglycan biosynthesis protein ExoM